MIQLFRAVTLVAQMSSRPAKRQRSRGSRHSRFLCHASWPPLGRFWQHAERLLDDTRSIGDDADQSRRGAARRASSLFPFAKSFETRAKNDRELLLRHAEFVARGMHFRPFDLNRPLTTRDWRARRVVEGFFQT